MADSNHYETLNITQTATQAEIKQAYRRLVKQYHPDSNPNEIGGDRIVDINAAYEVLGDRDSRQSYDRQQQSRTRHYSPQYNASKSYSKARSSRSPGASTDEQIEQWLKEVYRPLNRSLDRILSPLEDRIDDLSADPFDDDLMEAFCTYINTCRDCMKQAQAFFHTLPNPPSLARVAADLYHCLNQVGDGIDELESFTLNYDDRHLHTGQELFRIAEGLQRDAQLAIGNLIR
jgi:molecular chaperone DnaJ